MIILDTHIWVWWVHGSKEITETQQKMISENESKVIGICAISCWEIAKLVQVGRINFDYPLEEWFKLAFSYPGVQLIELSPQAAIESTRLSSDFHKDPADQIIASFAPIRTLRVPIPSDLSFVYSLMHSLISTYRQKHKILRMI